MTDCANHPSASGASLLPPNESAPTACSSSPVKQKAMPRSRRLWSTSHPATFMRFAAVATAVAGIDIGVLYTLHGAFESNVYLARVVSYTASMTAGYFLNRRYTFHDHRRSHSTPIEIMRYYAVFAGGGLVNYAVFSAVVAIGTAAGAGPDTRFWLPLLGVWLGGIAGMIVNYGFSHKLVFRNR